MIIIKGSVKGDGRIDLDDIILAHAHVLGLITLTPEQQIAADVNNDGQVSTSDLLMMHRHLLGTYTINDYEIEENSV